MRCTGLVGAKHFKLRNLARRVQGATECGRDNEPVVKSGICYNPFDQWS